MLSEKELRAILGSGLFEIAEARYNRQRPNDSVEFYKRPADVQRSWMMGAYEEMCKHLIERVKQDAVNPSSNDFIPNEWEFIPNECLTFAFSQIDFAPLSNYDEYYVHIKHTRTGAIIVRFDYLDTQLTCRKSKTGKVSRRWYPYKVFQK